MDSGAVAEIFHTSERIRPWDVLLGRHLLPHVTLRPRSATPSSLMQEIKPPAFGISLLLQSQFVFHKLTRFLMVDGFEQSPSYPSDCCTVWPVWNRHYSRSLTNALWCSYDATPTSCTQHPPHLRHDDWVEYTSTHSSTRYLLAAPHNSFFATQPQLTLWHLKTNANCLLTTDLFRLLRFYTAKMSLPYKRHRRIRIVIQIHNFRLHQAMLKRTKARHYTHTSLLLANCSPVLGVPRTSSTHPYFPHTFSYSITISVCLIISHPPVYRALSLFRHSGSPPTERVLFKLTNGATRMIPQEPITAVC